MQERVRFSHLHAVLNERDAFSHESVPLPHFPSVYSLSLVVVDGFRTGRPEVWIFGDVVIHCEASSSSRYNPKNVEREVTEEVFDLIDADVGRDVVEHGRCEGFLYLMVPPKWGREYFVFLRLPSE